MTSGLKMLPSVCGLGQHFQDLGHSFSLYGPPSRPITYIPSCYVETLYGAADTLSLWADLIRNIQCDGLHCKDRGRMCPVGCSRCRRFSPSQVAKGFGGYSLSFPEHFFVAPQGYFWKACGRTRICICNRMGPRAIKD